MSALHLMALCRPFLMLAGVTPTRLLLQRKSGIRTGRQAPTAFACTVTPEPDEVERPDWRPSCRHSNVRDGRLAVLAHTAGGNTLVHAHKLAAAAHAEKPRVWVEGGVGVGPCGRSDRTMYGDAITHARYRKALPTGRCAVVLMGHGTLHTGLGRARIWTHSRPDVLATRSAARKSSRRHAT